MVLLGRNPRIDARRSRVVARSVPPRCIGAPLASDERGELSAFVELPDDVASPNELAVHVELRDRWPVRVLLNLLSNAGVGEDVEGLKLRTVLLQPRDDFVREATRWEALVALHEEHDLVVLEEAIDGGLRICGHGESHLGWWRIRFVRMEPQDNTVGSSGVHT